MPVALKQSAPNSVAPTEERGVVEAVRAAYEAGEAIEVRGGGTAINFGAVSTDAGRSLELTGLSRVVDYTPRDMTILVEAGVRMADLAATLAAEGQHLPLDVPRASEATIGGVVATNWNGPRRYGHGTVRDYVIGVHAVDGRGVAFKGGGRVVKNVAGYDFCKLLTGSLGTLGVITQLALKVKPLPEYTATVVAECSELAIVERVVAQLVNLESPPVAVDLLVGHAWREIIREETSGELSAGRHAKAWLVVRVEGAESEVNWLSERIQSELTSAGGAEVHRLSADHAGVLWSRQLEFADRGAGVENDASPFVVQVAVPSSKVVDMVEMLATADAGCTIQAHAASGIIVARFAKFTQADLTSLLVGKLRPAAVRLGGSLIVLQSKLEGLTPHLVWGGRTDTVVLLEKIKRKFDPKGILNPGRYVFS
jgi:glycolate oxidase FAD binding subunit